MVSVLLLYNYLIGFFEFYMIDIFISYRRQNGEAWAAHIKELLEKRGARCYLDKHKKRTKDFKESLLKNIEQANNFLLILSENVFMVRSEEIDWVRDEIEYARNLNKNIIAVMFNGYDPTAVDWKNDEKIAFLETYECLKFDDTNLNLRNASIDTIIQYMVDENDKPWKNSLKDNSSWYEGLNITDEDRIWMYTNMEVCKKMDLSAFKQIMKNPIFIEKNEFNFFSLMTYDVDLLAKRTIDYNNELDSKKVNVFGLCHNFDLEHANNVFGMNHYFEYEDDELLESSIKKILMANSLKYFDIVDMTLILKDCKYPEKILRVITKYLNPNGSAIYIRDLDDDLLIAYPDECGLVNKAKELLSLDPGAGNRHFGKRIYTYLHKSGADEIYMTDLDVSTANFKVAMQRKICQAYFSYLVPEFKCLVESNPANEDYIDALNWLEQHYSELESLFESKEFYFRAGYISGFGIYKDDEFFED